MSEEQQDASWYDDARITEAQLDTIRAGLGSSSPAQYSRAAMRKVMAEIERLQGHLNAIATAHEEGVLARRRLDEIRSQEMAELLAENERLRAWLDELGYDALSVAQRLRGPTAAAQHPADGAERARGAMEEAPAPTNVDKVLRGPQSAVTGMRPEDAASDPDYNPLGLVGTVIRASRYQLRSPEARSIVAAVLTQLGLREEWGYRWGTDDDDFGSRAEGYDDEAGARIGAHPSDTIMRRYRTDWEDR